MKIGIIYCAYNCKPYIENSLFPFIEAKNKKIINEICAVSIPFLEYYEISNKNDGTTESLFNFYKDQLIDNIFTGPTHIQEHQARDLCLQYLKVKDCDIIWMVDGDEFYSISDIESIKRFVESNPDYYWYSINFKNYIFDGKQWIDGFCPPRIFKTKFNSLSIDKFYWDNDILYKNDKEESFNYKNLQNTQIPKEVAHIKHMTWLHSNSKEKYEYQMKHFGHCGYFWNQDKQEIEFNKEFYIQNNIDQPIVHKEN